MLPSSCAATEALKTVGPGDRTTKRCWFLTAVNRGHQGQVYCTTPRYDVTICPWVFFHMNKNPFYFRVKVKVIPEGGLTVRYLFDSWRRYLLVHWAKVTFNTHTHDDQKKWWRAAHEHRRRTETEKPAASSHLSQPSSNSQGTNRNNHKASVAAEKKWLQIPANLDWEKNENKLKCFFFF